MKRITKYRLMSSILAGTIFISGQIQNAIKVSASTINNDSSITTSTTQNTVESIELDDTQPTLEEFLNSIGDKQIKKFYTKLYELYDYETFSNRSVIPQYFQTIYGNKFSCGTIQSAGCGISSLAMVSSYLFGEVITPDMMTVFDSGPSPASAFEKGIKKLKLNCEVYRGQAAIDHLDEALDNGHHVIALMGRSSYFTNTGHFIVIAGKTEDGKYIVNDPNLENLYKPSMVEGFTNGFTRQEVTQGLNGLYIFDKKEEFIDRRDKEISIKAKKTTNNSDNTSYIGFTTQETSLRTSDSEYHPIITNLDINSEITRIFSTGNGWDLVKCNEYIGYIKTKSVSYTNDTNTEVSKYNHIKHNDIVITSLNTELKALPTDSSETITKIEKSTELEVISIAENGWLTISYNGKIGYVNNIHVESLLEIVQELYPELQLSELSTTKTVYMETDTELRCGNGIEFASLDLLEKYETARVICEYSDWYFALTNERNFGFIPKKNTSVIEDKCIVIDKSSEQLYYYSAGEQIYSTHANNIKKFHQPKSGFYSVLNKKMNLILFDNQSGWQNMFSSANHYNSNASDEVVSNIYSEIEKGDIVLIHK